MHSIIIPYRDRKLHLEKLLPRFLSIFDGKEYEILICEQDDDKPFGSAVIKNEGAKSAKGDIFVFHDVDYWPSDNVSYEIEDQPVYPYDKAIFLSEDDALRPTWDVPSGYRGLEKDATGHWGGVLITTRMQFFKVLGWCPLYSGWGKEDDDRHWRLTRQYVPIHREGTFYTLYHEDSCPPMDNPDFIMNHKLFANRQQNYKYGVHEQYCTVTELDANIKNVRWLKIKGTGEIFT